MKRGFSSLRIGLRGLSLAALLSAPSIAVAAPLEPANAKWNVNRSADGAHPEGYYGEWPGHAYFPSPDDWRAESVYQFITDRWNDGDPTNDDARADNPFGRFDGYDLLRVDARHGGDYQGITRKLDYIKSLGYTAIWISPVFQNRNNSYHGYGQVDFTVLDDRFGTLDDFRQMVDAAHAHGIRVIVDIVVNHLSDLYYFEGYRDGSAPFHFHSGEYKLFPKNAGETYRDFWVDNTYFSTGTYGSVYGSDGSKVDDLGGGSFWFSDLHHNGNLWDYGDPWQNHLGKIYGGLDDLRLEHPRVQSKIVAMTKALVASTDIDGIRMDTPMQVPLSFFKRWAPEVKAYAASLGKRQFGIWGEFYCDRGRAATMVGRGRTPDQWGQQRFIDGSSVMDGGINYRLYYGFFNPAVRDQSPWVLGKLAEEYAQDRVALDFANPAHDWAFEYRNWNFYNNHDQWRLAAAPDGFRKTDLGSAIVAFYPGMPLFYYGDEQGFLTRESGIGGHSREDMMTSLAWKSFPLDGGPNPAEGDNFDMTNPHYRWVQKVMNVRRHYAPLQQSEGAVERWRQESGNAGIYAFTRDWAPISDAVLVAFNTWKFALEAGKGGVFATGWREGDEIVNVLEPTERLRLGKDGRLDSLWLGGYETKVFVRADRAVPLDPVVTSVSPAHDAAVSAAPAVRLAFSEDMDAASVLGALRFDGQPLPAGLARWDAARREVSFTPSAAADGVHTVEVLEGARSAAGAALFGAFRSRFRKGGAANVIVNPAATSDDTLIQQVSGASVRLSHKAAGASWLRVKNDGGAFGAWVPYAPQTEWTLGGSSGVQRVTVQYWADGSAAYLVGGSIDLGGPVSDVRRTVVLVQGTTKPGQDLFVRGGIDHAQSQLVRGIECTTANYACAIPIVHRNLRNATNAPLKKGDTFLDWYGAQAGQASQASGTPADWTTNAWDASWGAVRTVDVDGYGVTSLNRYGPHYWMVDVDMDCARAFMGPGQVPWFEVKTFITNGDGWEPDVKQTWTDPAQKPPYASGNHFAQCGKVNVFRRGSGDAVIVPFTP